jgi:DNA primase large subunit
MSECLPKFERVSVQELSFRCKPVELGVLYSLLMHFWGPRAVVRGAVYVVEHYITSLTKLVDMLKSLGMRAGTVASLFPQIMKMGVPNYVAVSIFDAARFIDLRPHIVYRGYALLPYGYAINLAKNAYAEAVLAAVRKTDIEEIARLNEKHKQFIQTVLNLYELPRPPPSRGPEGTPPCMEAIINAIKSGVNVPHNARFAIVTYLLHRGWDVEQIVDLFRTLPDFNEKITRYQVQHIAGQVGGRKRYAVPSCETMASWGLCPTNLGCGVKSPLRYRRPRTSAE